MLQYPQMQPTQWFTKFNGTAIAVPGMKPDEAGQCVVAMNSYLHDVIGQPYLYTPTAIGIWTNSLLNSRGFVKVNAGQPIKAGDFIFYDSGIGAPEGHVSVASRDGLFSDFWAYDSNYGGASFKVNGFPTLHEVHHNDRFNNYIVGYYRFTPGRGSEQPTANIGATMIPDQDNYFARMQKSMYLLRGRDVSGKGFSRDEFRKNFVGQTPLRMLEIMSDDAEANQAHAWMATGFVATRDDWAGQIKTLSGQLQDVKTELLKLQQTPAVEKIVNKCDVNLDQLPAEDASALVKFVAWLTGRGK